MINVVYPSDFSKLENTTTENLPEGFQITPTIGAHKLYTSVKPWNSARRNCYDVGGHLAVVDSAAELEVLKKLVVNGTAWIGVHRLFKADEYDTIHDAPMEFVSWAPKEPENKNCIGLGSDGFDAEDCIKLMNYICEIKI
ncbi:TPA: C-type lectin domain-containing protein [Salmonella enterica subsp. enterica serovar Derby]|nr:C-type lectin domain-containing protein [Salmonella enterica subsp. enterica serovar Derby]